MDIDTRKDAKAFVVKLSGRMDAVTAPEFDKKFAEWLGGGESVFVVNLGGLEYISSAGLRSVLSAAKQLKAKSGKALFTGLQGPVKEVFQLSGFYSILEICDSEEAALQKAQ